MLQPTIDATGRVVLFGFQMGELPGGGGSPSMSFTLSGRGIQLNQLTCRPAPAPPPIVQHRAKNSSPKATAPEDPGFIWFELSWSDLLLVSLASIITLLLLWRHWRDMCACWSPVASQSAFELASPTYDEEQMPRARSMRAGRSAEDAAPFRVGRVVD